MRALLVFACVVREAGFYKLSYQAAAPAWNGRKFFTSFRTKRLRLLGTGGGFLQVFVPSGCACLEREPLIYKF